MENTQKDHIFTENIYGDPYRNGVNGTGLLRLFPSEWQE